MKQHASIIPMADSSKRITVQDVTPTVLPDAFLRSEEASAAARFHMPRYHDLPAVDLYRDQVISQVEAILEPLSACSEGPWLTPSMVNNYVKMRLVDPPARKLYGREQVARLLIICIFKQFLPMEAISRLFKIQRMTYPVETAFDYVAVELNHAVEDAFALGRSPHEDSASAVTRETLLVRSATGAFAAKAFLDELPALHRVRGRVGRSMTKTGARGARKLCRIELRG